MLWTYVPENWNVEEIVRAFTKTSSLEKKTKQTEFKTEKVMKKVTNYMPSRKVMIFHLTAGLLKRNNYRKLSYY